MSAVLRSARERLIQTLWFEGVGLRMSPMAPLLRWLLALINPPPAVPVDRFDEALAHCAAARWGPAFDTLASLADEGQPHAARLALQMARHGQRLFGHRCWLAPARQARWLALQPGGTTGLAA